MSDACKEMLRICTKVINGGQEGYGVFGPFTNNDYHALKAMTLGFQGFRTTPLKEIWDYSGSRVEVKADTFWLRSRPYENDLAGGVILTIFPQDTIWILEGYGWMHNYNSRAIFGGIKEINTSRDLATAIFTSWDGGASYMKQAIKIPHLYNWMHC